MNRRMFIAAASMMPFLPAGFRQRRTPSLTLPAGETVINSPLVLAPGEILTGQGHNSVLRATFDGPAVVMADGSHVANVRILGPGRSSLNSYGIVLPANFGSVRDVHIESFCTGVQATGTWGASLDRLRVIDAEFGLRSQGQTQATIKAHGLWLQNIYTCGIVFDRADACDISDVEIFGLGDNRKGVVIGATNGGINNFTRVVVDGWGQGAFEVWNAYGETRFTDCRGGAQDGYYALKAENATALWATGCNFSVAGSAVYLKNASQVWLLNNSINPRQQPVGAYGVICENTYDVFIKTNRFSQSPQAHIEERGTADRTLVSDNIFAESRPVYLYGANSRQWDNLGLS